MSKKRILTIIIILFSVLSGIIWYQGNRGNKGNNRNQGELANPGGKQVENQPAAKSLTLPYNPPQEVKYSRSADLRKELDSVDPQVLDEDFNGL